MSDCNESPLEREDSTDRIREAYPSGCRGLTRNESVAAMIAALLDLPPSREFNRAELADLACVSRQSVHRHIGLLVRLGVVEVVDGTGPRRYRFDPTNPVSEELVRLDGAINVVSEEPTA